MVKFTNSNPNSKRKGVKKETMPYITVFSDINTHSLTAMQCSLRNWGLRKTQTNNPEVG